MSNQIHKIAAYRTKWGCISFIEEQHKHAFDADADYVQLTEFVEVSFPGLPPKDVLEKQLAQIDKAESEARAKFQAILNGFERQRQELLALPNIQAEA